MEYSVDFFKNLLDQMHDGVYFVDLGQRIIYWNQAAKRISGFCWDEVVRCSCSDNILEHIDENGRSICKNGCPLALTLGDGQVRKDHVFLHNKAGHRVPVEITVTPIKDVAGKIIGAVEVFREAAAAKVPADYLETLKQAALSDVLTGLPNRRFLEMKLRACQGEADRYNVPYGVLFVDIDDFKKVNDRHGHGVGDQVLQMVANNLSHNIRESDVAGRWGGEELVVILSHLDPDQLAAIAEKLRMLVESSYLLLEMERVQVTITIGATMALPGDGPEGVIRRADQLMYQGKKLKNCVRIG
ncbi:diguanylate cyclase [Desulfuromonas versatilis]|uniref:Diguanylate cyclase n=1 Tax=Desulfuromonas versatilis TaxID=2802975 RepID=A0ABM8HTQ4_9BACT|nr:GGDEF domain-containing protein [Desulfuromonas versatilis]BCR05705.1 diguanylate cyclase [Desulfuromonas versatilis]